MPSLYYFFVLQDFEAQEKCKFSLCLRQIALVNDGD